MGGLTLPASVLSRAESDTPAAITTCWRTPRRRRRLNREQVSVPAWARRRMRERSAGASFLCIGRRRCLPRRRRRSECCSSFVHCGLAGCERRAPGMAGAWPPSSGAPASSPERARVEDRVLPGGAPEQFDDDSLFGLGHAGARATAPGCPVSEVGCGRAAVVSEARIGTGAQEGLDSGRTSVPDSPVQWCHAAGSGCVGISARLDEIGNDIPLACGVPAHRTRDTGHRGVQRLGAPPVSGPDAGSARDQVLCHLGVVTEPRGVKGSVAFVNLGETLGE